jgi:uncharacterized protein (DUF885 family)
MKRLTRVSRCAMAALLLAGVSIVEAAPRAATATQKMHALFDSAWQEDLRADPTRASYLGDNRYNERWTDMSLAGHAARNKQNAATLARLRAIPRAALPPAEQLNYDLFAREYQQRLQAYQHRAFLYAINPRDGIQSQSETAELLPFQSLKDYQDWLGRLRGIGSLVDQHIELLTAAAAEKRTQPRVIMQRLTPQLALQAVDKPEDSPFFQPFRRMPDSIPAAQREPLLTAGRDVIATVVIPAYRRLQQHFLTQYLPATRSSVGISDTPGGADYYRNRIEFHTTLSGVTADEIHAIGLREVERIRGEMLKITAKVGFTGTLQEFFVHLRSDPKFYYRTPEELFAAYESVSKRIDPNLVRLFGTLPRTPYGVRAIPATAAPNTTTAYYQPPAVDGTRPGYYYVNLYRPEVRPKYEMEVLSIHEAVPGHHLQIALALEQASLPEFRRNAEFTAYVEGWALYSESLGEELGLYQDPYSKFGQLTYDMWRAVRLVVDTGIHAKDWTRQQAIDFFKDNAAKTEVDIVNEIDRYISWPGQALAYKLGQLRIQSLRREAEQKLGTRFDIRAFHDALLATGAIPLDVMEGNMRRWIATRASKQ